MANPWIFRQIQDVMNGREPFQPTLEDKRALLLEYFEMLQQDMPKLPAIGEPYAGRSPAQRHLTAPVAGSNAVSAASSCAITSPRSTSGDIAV